ncbi:hypothetical protein MASR2M47_25880 [Draconibacterium sp.]
MKTITFGTAPACLILLMLIAGYANSTIIAVDKKGTVIGRLSDFTTNEPIEFALIDLFAVKDSTLVVGTLTDNEGKFTISMLDSGNYYIEISERNFEKKQIQSFVISENISKINLGEILLFRLPRKSPKSISRLPEAGNRANRKNILAHEK